MRDKLERAAELVLIQAGVVPESKVIIGVSGGPDSLALLHVMRGYMAPGCLRVAHLNHGLRPEADEEAGYVAQVAESWGLPFRGKKVDVQKLAHSHSYSVEEAGRKARYQFLAELAEEMGADAAVVAHNADDQAETVLLNLLRGSGLTGLRGMLTQSSLFGAPGVQLIRPFLKTTRAEIEAYCQIHALRPMLDSTNIDPVYLRNRLRHELLPLLADFNPKVKQHLNQLAEIVAADEAYLDEQSDLAWRQILSEQKADWLRLNRAKWRALPLSLQRRTLRRALAELRPSISDISFRTIDMAHQIGMKKETGAEAKLPEGITMHLDYEQILFAADLEQVRHDQPQLPAGKPQTLSIPGGAVLERGWQLKAAESEVNFDQVRRNRDPWVAYFDIGQEKELTVRTRAAGESFQPLGMDARSASIQDVMVNCKLSAALRDRWPVVSTQEHLVWLVGLQMDERVKVTERSRRIIQIRCHRPGVRR